MIDNVTTDNMSNEEVIETLKGIVFNGFDRTTRKERQALDLAIKALEDRPQGEWIHVYTDIANYFYKCSICGREIKIKGKPLSDYPFCHCGADMRGKEE